MPLRLLLLIVLAIPFPALAEDCCESLADCEVLTVTWELPPQPKPTEPVQGLW